MTIFAVVTDWIKLAKRRQLDEFLASMKRNDAEHDRTEELREAEKNWIDRVETRVKEVNAEGLSIHVLKKDETLRLVNRGIAEIELTEPSCFEITYKNILPPTTLLLRNPIWVHHHRVVKVRELNAHNIEEVLKFVALGMKDYMRISRQSRIEYNLEGMFQAMKKDEHERSG